VAPLKVAVWLDRDFIQKKTPQLARLARRLKVMPLWKPPSETTAFRSHDQSVHSILPMR
jgi:hypothetical protein